METGDETRKKVVQGESREREERHRGEEKEPQLRMPRPRSPYTQLKWSAFTLISIMGDFGINRRHMHGIDFVQGETFVWVQLRGQEFFHCVLGTTTVKDFHK